MRRLWLLLLVPLLAATACSRYQGPLEIFRKNKAEGPSDGGRQAITGAPANQKPYYNLDEQARRARERVPNVGDDPVGGPKGYADGPNPIGR